MKTYAVTDTATPTAADIKAGIAGGFADACTLAAELSWQTGEPHYVSLISITVVRAVSCDAVDDTKETP